MAEPRTIGDPIYEKTISDADRDVQNVIVKQKHPWYNATITDSEFYRQTYLGGKEYDPDDTNLLFKHPSEQTDWNTERRKRAYYINYVASPINLFLAALFKEKTLSRDKIDSSFAADVDGMGTPIDIFFREAAKAAIVEDIAYVVIDRPRVVVKDGEPDQYIETKAQAREANVAPRFVLKRKADVLDWVFDNDGVTSVKIREEVPGQTDLRKERKDTKVYKYIIWTRNDWQEFDHDGKANGDPHPHNLGVVPIVPLYADKMAEWQGLSWIRDIARINRAIFNYDSLIDEFLFFNGIAQPVFQADSPDEIKGLKRGNAPGMTYPRDTNPPFLLTADQGPYASLKDKREDLKVAIYLLFKVRLLNPLATAVGASGESKAQDYIATNQTLADLADNIQTCENMCHYIYQLWELDGNSNAAENAQAVANYPDNFDIIAIEDEIKAILDLQPVRGLPTSFMTEKLKDLARKMLAQNPNLDQVLDDIDAIANAETAREIVEKATESVEEPEEEAVLNTIESQ